MTNYKTEQEKQDKEFEKTMLITLGGSWLECSDYEGTVAEMKFYLLSRDTALLEAFKKDVGEMVEKEQEKLKEYPIWNEFVKGENESFELLLSLLKDYNLNK